MSWNYSGNPADSQVDEVRFLIGDTEACDQFLQDEEIEYILVQEGDPAKAAARAAEALVAKFARLVSESVGSVKLSCEQKYDHYKELCLKLRSRADMRLAIPFAGGISETDKETREDDDDRVEPLFRKTTHDSVDIDGEEELEGEAT